MDQSRISKWAGLRAETLVKLKLPGKQGDFSTTDIVPPSPQGSEAAMQLLAADDLTYNFHALKCLRDRTLYSLDDAHFADKWRVWVLRRVDDTTDCSGWKNRGYTSNHQFFPLLDLERHSSRLQS